MTTQPHLDLIWSQSPENRSTPGTVEGVFNFHSDGPRPRPATAAIRFLESLRVPEGKNAGKPLKLGRFQRKFVKGALRKDIEMGILCVARGGGKSALSAGLALGALLGIWDPQPRRGVIVAANSREQGAIVKNFAQALCQYLPPEIQQGLIFRRAPRLEIEWEGDGGGHVLQVVPADGKVVLGTSPVFCVMDERGHWPDDRGDELEQALLTGLGKRGGKALMISTSAPNDAHPFSQWIDNPPPRTYVQEHRPAPGLPADDLDSLLEANPGAKNGIGSTPDWLKSQAERAIARGGSSLTSFRLFNRNERVTAETRDLLLTLDEWLAVETDDLPPREGPCVIGVDLGGSASMTAAAYYWPQTGRLEAQGWFPNSPSLMDRGQADGVAGRYVEMEARGELATLGDKTVPVAEWFGDVMGYVDGEAISAMVADRYRMSELAEAMDKAGINCPVIWRGMGFRDGGEDVERFRRAVFDGAVSVIPSLLMRSALADAVCLRDPANNAKLAKARSKGRIDAAAAAVLAVAEGARQVARPMRAARTPQWA